jgi:hypothetical protein
MFLPGLHPPLQVHHGERDPDAREGRWDRGACEGDARATIGRGGRTGAEAVHTRRAWRCEEIPPIQGVSLRRGAGRGLEPLGARGHQAADGDDGVLEDLLLPVLREVQQPPDGLHLRAGA